MRYRFSRRPLEAQVWAGWALYAEDANGVQEIHLGIMTSCRTRCDDRTLIFESCRNGSAQEMIVKTGSSLFEWHTAVVTDPPTAIQFDLDGKRLSSITDPGKSPRPR